MKYNESECFIRCDDCGKLLDRLLGEDIFIDSFVFEIDESKVVCTDCEEKFSYMSRT